MYPTLEIFQDYYSYHQLQSKGFTPNHVGLIYRQIKDSPIGKHYGVLVFENNRFVVYHLCKENKKIKRDNVEKFCEGYVMTIENGKIPNSNEIYERLSFARINYSMYSLPTNNCEDFARYLYEGKRISYQVVTATVLGGLIWYTLVS